MKRRQPVVVRLNVIYRGGNKITVQLEGETSDLAVLQATIGKPKEIAVS